MKSLNVGQEIHTVLFDLDGTLIDSRADLTSAVNFALVSAGRAPKAEKDVIPHVGNGLAMLLTHVMGPMENGVLESATKSFVDFYDVHCVDETKLYDGVWDCLNELGATTKLGVVTNKPAGFAEKIIRKLGLGNLIAVVVGGDTLAEKKPHPAPVLKAMHDLGGSINSTLVVGDGIQDIKAAQAAGIKTCVAQYGYGYSESLMGFKPDYAIKNFKELKEIVLWQR